MFLDVLYKEYYEASGHDGGFSACANIQAPRLHIYKGKLLEWHQFSIHRDTP
jgi:hypothetical protein